jgi:hypothetical protein
MLRFLKYYWLNKIYSIAGPTEIVLISYQIFSFYLSSL